ncbi:MFS transporter [Candidatus Pacearchaeota archaeon]|nr:MFS transporter [Candidatus Pacearchaeota archaeon]
MIHKLFSKKELKLLWPFYTNSFMMILFFVIPFMVVHFSSLGFSATQIGLLFAVWPLGSLLFEIPTGAIADIYGRKFSVISGGLLMGIFLTLIYFFQSYWIIMILLALVGISQTLTTGSREAWVVDLLNANKMEKFQKSFFAKSYSIANIGVVISGLLGAFLVSNFGLKIIWFAGGLSFFISSFFLSFAQEKYKKQKTNLKDSMKEVVKQSKTSIKFGYRHPVLFYLFIITFLFAISFSIRGFVAWTPFLTSLNFPKIGFGYLWSALGIMGIIAPLLSNKFSKENKEKKTLITISFIFIFLGIIIFFSNNLIILLASFLCLSFTNGFRVPIREVYFQRFIPSKLRATVGSIRSLIIGISSIIGLTVSGLIVDAIGGRYAIIIALSLMIPVIILYLMIKEDKIKTKIRK